MSEATPTPPPPPPAAPPPAPAAPAAAPAPTCPCERLMPLAILAGAFLLFVAFFLPWWGVTFKLPQFKGEADEKALKEYKDASKSLDRVRRESQDWYQENGVNKKIEKKYQDEKEIPSEVGVSLFGWNTGAGVTAFVFFFIVAALVLAPMFVPLIRPFAWVGYFMAAIMYFIIFMITAIGWLICSPGENVSPFLAQGISIGVWFALLGSMLTTAAAAMAGLKGLMGFLAGMKKQA